MSLILEALNKAERERNGSAAPSAIDTAPAAPSHKTSWRLLVIGLGLMAVGLAAFYLNSRHTAAPPPTVADAATEPQAPEVIAPPPAMPATQPPQTAPAPPPPANEMALHNTDEGERLQSLIARPQPTPATVAAIQQATPDVPAEEEQKPAIAFAEPQEIAPVDPPAEQVSATNFVEDEYDGAPIFQNLPADIKAQLPKLELNIHVYSEDPAKRFVYINSHRYREGAALQEGVTLERITPTGVVLRTRETLFRLVIET